MGQCCKVVRISSYDLGVGIILVHEGHIDFLTQIVTQPTYIIQRSQFFFIFNSDPKNRIFFYIQFVFLIINVIIKLLITTKRLFLGKLSTQDSNRDKSMKRKFCYGFYTLDDWTSLFR